MRPAQALLALTLTLPALPGTPDAARAAGAADRVIATHASIAANRSVRVVAAPDGGLFAAYQVDDPVNGGQVKVAASFDGGDTWVTQSTFGDADGNTSTGYFEPVLALAPAPTPRLLLALRYSFLSGATLRGTVNVYARNLPPGGWSSTALFSTVGTTYSTPDLCVSPGDPTHVYAVCMAADGNGNDLWFARSTTTGASWAPPYAIASSGAIGTGYSTPRLAVGTSNIVHVAYTFSAFLATPPVSANYRRALNDAANGITDWQAPLTVEPGYRDPVVCASPTNALVTLTSYDPATQTSASRNSSNAGGTFLASATHWLPSEPAATTWAAPVPEMLTAGLYNGRVVFGEAFGATIPGVALSDHAYVDDFADRVAVVRDPAFDGSPGVAWLDAESAGEDTLFFDAGWRGSFSFPSHGLHSPLATLFTPVTPPTLVNLDDDPQLEIVFGDGGGLVHVLDADLTEHAGWPRPIGAFPLGAGIAVGDLDGDGHADVTAGDATGRVWAFHADGGVLPGFPVTLPGNLPAFLSIGDVEPGGGEELVANCGPGVYALRGDASMPPGFPVTTSPGSSAGAPAAIGPLSGSGAVSIVAPIANELHVIAGDGSTTGVLTLPAGSSFAGAPVLADMAGAEDLEIVATTQQLKVWALRANGSLLPGAWPYSVPAAGTLTGPAVARFPGAPRPWISFSDATGHVYLLKEDASVVPGWPQDMGQSVLRGAPVIDRLDGLGSNLVQGGSTGMLHGWNDAGVALYGFPKPLGGAIPQGVATGDVDADGRVDVVVISAGWISLLHSPQLVDRTDPARVWSMEGYSPEHDYCLACGAHATTAVGPAAGPALSFAAPAPNPSRGEVSFALGLPSAAEVQVTVLDVQGRAVRALHRGALGAGAARFTWDGRDAGGATVAGGMYFVRAEVRDASGAHSATRRFARLR